MKKKEVKKKVIFKAYSQENLELPPIEELIGENHIVRKVSKILDELNIKEELEKKYKGGGSSAYNPLMLLKVLIYGYCVKVYTSRKLEQAVNQDIRKFGSNWYFRHCSKIKSRYSFGTCGIISTYRGKV